MLRWLAGTLLVCTVLPEAADAQEFRIYTRVFKVEAAAAEEKAARTELVGRSLSLFHAGKVYDETDGEVTVFEPAQERFTILNPARATAASVHFDELLQRLARDRAEVERVVSEKAREGGAPASAVARTQFLLSPSFEEKFEEQPKRLVLSNAHLTYRAAGAQTDAEIVDLWCRYADWTARLNYVLHPQSLYPEPRLALNEALRRRKLLPIEVELDARLAAPLRLRAEHHVHWKLDATDRRLIEEWESLLRSSNTRRVTFPEYQRAGWRDER